MTRQQNAKFSHRCRRALGLLLLLACCAPLIPLPQLATIPEKDDSQPFPCLNRPCGCHSAAQCWKQCCCFSHRQKIAWAKENNVAIPDFVIAAAAAEARHDKEIVNRPRCEHCVARQESCPVAVADRSPATTAEQPAPAASANAATGSATATPPRRFFHGIAALECHGLTSLLQILSMTVIPVPPAPEVAADDHSSLLVLTEPLLTGRGWPLPEPPPKLGIAGFLPVSRLV